MLERVILAIIPADPLPNTMDGMTTCFHVPIPQEGSQCSFTAKHKIIIRANQNEGMETPVKAKEEER
jgi:hypothetical protein